MRFLLTLTSACFVLIFCAIMSRAPFASAAPQQQQAMKLILCEGIAVDRNSRSADALPVRPTKVFSPKGTDYNIFVVATFNPFPGDKLLKFIVTDEKGSVVEDREAPITVTHKGTYAFFTIVTAGKYTVQVVDKYNEKTVYARDAFTVLPDTVGPRATGNIKAGLAKLTVCKTVDDNWEPVGASTVWPANTPFNVLLVSPVPFHAPFIGFIIHRQGPDGKDVAFVDEWQQRVVKPDTDRKYCTMEGLTSLPAGKYSIYAIDWYKREASEHRGNLTEYFSKITLTVQ
jgi:hypothetical protein